MNINKIIPLVAIVFFMASCQQPTGPDNAVVPQNIMLAPGQYVVDEPENLTEYFHNLCLEHGAIVAVHSSDYEDSLQVWQTIQALDDFAAGRRQYYPAEEVKDALGSLAFELGYWYSHGEQVDTNHLEMFFFRLLEQAVRLSPQVDYVTDFHASDGTAGILNYHEWSPNPLYSFLIYPTDNGLRVTQVGETGFVKTEKLFHLTDDSGRDYYLCSNNGDFGNEDVFVRVFFCQHLFMCDETGVREVASYSDFESNYEENSNCRVVFNPQQLRWDLCKRDGDKYIRVDNTPSLFLEIDGLNSIFYLE